MRPSWKSTTLGAAAALTIAFLGPARAQQHLQVIQSFSVGPDTPLTYPNTGNTPSHLVDLPDEHTTFIPLAPSGYLVFASSKLSGGTGGAVALQTSDLLNFNFATALGYNRQVMAPPIGIDVCDPAYTTEFDGNYAAPGTVVQDPTLPAGNLMMFYEAENHCPSGVNQQPFYATVGFARSSDNGKTWPAPINGPLGGPARHPILQSSDPQPSVAHPAMGDAIPSAYIDKSATGDYYAYVAYGYHDGTGNNDGLARVARAKLGPDPLSFSKWYYNSFSQPGIGGSDTGVLPGPGCTNGRQAMPEINFNDDLDLYLMIVVCVNGPSIARVGAWYYSTATSLDLQDWTPPQMIQNSQFPVTSPCSADGQSGGQFDGWYPSFMSEGAASGHTKLTGHVFFQNGCDTGARQFVSRSFTITAGPPPTPVLTSGSAANGATYLAGGLVPGSWAQVKGSNLAGVTRTWVAFDFLNLGNALPTNLSGTSVTVNGLPAALYYVSSTQVDFQVPAGVSGTASVQVFHNGAGSNVITAAVPASAPAIFPIPVNGINYAAGVFLDNKIVGDPTVSSSFRNAKPGEVIQLFGTGLAISPAGTQVSVQPVGGVTVTLGTITVLADAAALVVPGEFQINFTVPQQFANLPTGNYPLTVAVNGVSSPARIQSSPPGPVVIPIQH